jgi:flagellar assembly protein FliH
LSAPKALPSPAPAPLVATPLADRLAQVPLPQAAAWLSAAQVASAPPRPLFVKETPGAVVDTAASAASEAKTAAMVAELEAAKKDLTQARVEAEKEGLAAAQTKIEEIVERYLDGIQRLLAATRLAHRPEPGEVVELALVVAKEIIGRELVADRTQLLASVDRALTSVSADTQLVLRVSPGDATYVKQRRPELLRDGVVIVEDKALTVGGCIVETPAWVLDASIEARLEAVREGLVEIMQTSSADETRDEDDLPRASAAHADAGDDIASIDEEDPS